jgi:prefoldin alpha subunit
MADEKQKQMQQKYMEMQMLEQQMQHVQKQLQLLEQQNMELVATREAIDEIASAPAGKEILVPISSGIFIKGQLKENKELTVNVGANVAVNKSVDDTKALIEEQIHEVENFRNELSMNMQKLASKAQELENELSNLIK